MAEGDIGGKGNKLIPLDLKVKNIDTIKETLTLDYKGNEIILKLYEN